MTTKVKSSVLSPILTGLTSVTSNTFTSDIVTGTAPFVVASTTAVLNLTADKVTTNANLTGMVTSVGNATTVVTNANLTGDVTSVGNATTLTNAPVIAKVLTGYVSGAGTVAATDSILQAIQKLNGNKATNANLTGMVTSVGNATTVVTNANLTGDVTSVGNATTVVTNANLTGDVTSVGNATTLTNAPVIAKVLTGYVSGAGTVAATDSILQAIQKLNGNKATNANLTGAVTSVGNASSLGSFTSLQLLTALTDESGTGANVFAVTPALTGTPTAPTAAVNTSTTQIATTAFANPASSLAANGYVKLPSGVIIQWGSVTGSGSPVITFPIPFPSALGAAMAMPNNTSTTAPVPYISARSTTGFTVTFAGTSTNWFWFAIGY